MPVEMTLTEKVHAVLFREESGDPLTAGAGALPNAGGLGEFELNLRDWGMVYGLAFGLARTEEACEPTSSVAERAQEAALAAYTKWGGEFAPRRPLDPLVTAVLRAYHGEDEAQLGDAIIKLGNTVGWPATEEVAA